jgi:bifunctional DNA primase/polymerase-like protein
VELKARLSDLTPSAPTVEFAAIYARRGLEIMPRFGTADGKLIDALRGSPRAGLIGEAEVRSYWQDNPRVPALALVCGPASGLFAIDLDQHDPERDGLASRTPGARPRPPTIVPDRPLAERRRSPRLLSVATITNPIGRDRTRL